MLLRFVGVILILSCLINIGGRERYLCYIVKEQTNQRRHFSCMCVSVCTYIRVRICVCAYACKDRQREGRRMKETRARIIEYKHACFLMNSSSSALPVMLDLQSGE